MTDIIKCSVIQRPWSEEGNVETGCKAVVHVFVDDVICFAADDAGFEKVRADLGDARIGSSSVSTGNCCI